MPYYRCFPSNRQLSGEYAHLNRKRITWLESYDSQTWVERTGKIVVVGNKGKAYFVDPEHIEGRTNGRHWIELDTKRCKDIRIEGE